MAETSRYKSDFAVYFDGTKLTGEPAAAILGIRVYQTRAGASAFEMVVSDPNLKWQDDPTFTECKEVKIELGTVGKLKQVFDGEVTAWLQGRLNRKRHYDGLIAALASAIGIAAAWSGSIAAAMDLIS